MSNQREVTNEITETIVVICQYIKETRVKSGFVEPELVKATADLIESAKSIVIF